MQSKLPDVGTTIFSTISALSKEKNAINLGQGFPDFKVDSKLIRSVHNAMIAGHNQYAPMAGIFPLRNEISKKIRSLYDVSFDPESEITICSGATEGIFSAINALVRENDEVILMEPAYDCYKPAVELAGGTAVPIPLEIPNFKIDIGRLKDAITERTRFIMVNTPHNPTGTLIEPAEWKILSDIAEEHDLYILSDEVYEHIVFDGNSHQAVFLNEKLRDRFVAFYSFGKTFHVTGWKVGYIVAPETITAEIRKVHQYNVFSVNTAVQYGLSEFLADEENYRNIDALFERKLQILRRALKDSILHPLPCKGTYFMLVDYSEFSNKSDLEACKQLIEEAGVATIPLSPFISDNDYDEKLLRICFAKKDAVLQQAGKKLQAL